MILLMTIRLNFNKKMLWKAIARFEELVDEPSGRLLAFTKLPNPIWDTQKWLEVYSRSIVVPMIWMTLDIGSFWFLPIPLVWRSWL